MTLDQEIRLIDEAHAALSKLPRRTRLAALGWLRHRVEADVEVDLANERELRRIAEEDRIRVRTADETELAAVDNSTS